MRIALILASTVLGLAAFPGVPQRDARLRGIAK